MTALKKKSPNPLAHKPKPMEDIFVEIVVNMIHMSPAELHQLALDAGVAPQTTRNWAWGITCNPHLNTVVKIATALGYEVKLIRPTKLRSVK